MVLEDGTGVAGADSYAAQAATTTFHAARGNAAWAAATSAQQTAGLIVATDYLEASYVASDGPLSATQGLQFPTGELGLPAVVVKATMLLALEALAGPLNERVDRGVKALTESKDGTGSVATVYDDAAPADPFPHITNMLASVASCRAAGGAQAIGFKVTK